MNEDLRRQVAALTANGDHKGLFGLTLELLQAGEASAAEEVARAAQGAGSAEILPVLAITLDQQGRAGEAEVVYRQAIAAGDDSSIIQLADMLQTAGSRAEEAEELARRGAERGVPSAQFVLGKILASQPGREAEAEAAFLAEAEASIRPMVQFELAQLLLRAPGRQADAERALRDSGLPHAQYLLAGLLREMPGREEEAVGALWRAAESDVPGAWYKLTVTLRELGQTERADAAYRDGLGRGAMELRPYYGDFLQMQGRQAEAEQVLRAGLPTDPLCAYVLGSMLLKEPGRVDEGRELLIHAAGKGVVQAAIALARTRNVMGGTLPPSPDNAPVALTQLPLVTAGLVGRDGEMAALAQLLDPTAVTDSVVVAVIAGLAGVGKTTLALQAGRRAQSQGWFAGGVLFIDLLGYGETPADPAMAVGALLKALRVPAADIPPSLEERVALYRSALSQIREPTLVIIDNAASEAQVRSLLPGEGPHRVLVTSRHTLTGLGAPVQDITILDRPTSIILLDAALRLARPEDDRIEGDPDSAGRLADLCGGLPLALQIVAASLNADPTRGIADLAEEFAPDSTRLERLRYADAKGTVVQSVSTAFESSYNRLDAIAARAFRLLSWNPGPDLSTAAAAELFGLPVSDAREVLSSLAGAHLAETAPSAPGRWRMNDLLCLYGQQLIENRIEAEDVDGARDRLLRYYLRMTASAGKERAGTGIPEEFTSRDSALAWLDAERASLVAAVQMAADTGHDEAALTLYLGLAEYLHQRQRFEDLLSVATVSLRIAQNLSAQPVAAMALRNMCLALTGLRRFREAITAGQVAAVLYREAGDRRGEGMALNNVGLAQREAGALVDAIASHQQDLDICREAGDRHGEAGALNNLCLAWREAGVSDEALAAGQAAAVIYREEGDRHGESMALNNLGLALWEAGRFAEAISAHQQDLDICRETGDRHGQGMALNNLGQALRSVERLAEAILAHQDAIDLYRETADRHGEGLAWTGLGLSLWDARRYEEAVTAYQDAAAIFHEINDRTREANALNNLGAAFCLSRRFEEAMTAYQGAAAIYRETGDEGTERMVLKNIEQARAAQRQSTTR